MLKVNLKITVITSTEDLFNVLLRNGNETENCLMIYTKAKRETYNDWAIYDIIWVRQDLNLYETMTKPTILL